MRARWRPTSRSTRQMKKYYPFSRLSGPANVLVMPGLQSANISAKLLRELGGDFGDRPDGWSAWQQPVQIATDGAPTASELVTLAGARRRRNRPRTLDRRPSRGAGSGVPDVPGLLVPGLRIDVHMRAGGAAGMGRTQLADDRDAHRRPETEQRQAADLDQCGMEPMTAAVMRRVTMMKH